MKIWRLQTKTDGGDLSGVCLTQNIIVMGWPLDEKDREKLRNNPSFDNYCSFADHHYTKQNYGPVERLAKETQVNDIVWMRHKGEYYFSRIKESSNWLFDFSDTAVESDSTNRRVNIKWCYSF